MNRRKVVQEIYWLNYRVIPTCAEGSRWREGPAARQSVRRRTPGLSRVQTLPDPPTQTLPVEIRSLKGLSHEVDMAFDDCRIVKIVRQRWRKTNQYSSNHS
jgi:hypothetical protein